MTERTSTAQTEWFLELSDYGDVEYLIEWDKTYIQIFDNEKHGTLKHKIALTDDQRLSLYDVGNMRTNFKAIRKIIDDHL
jgi:hypothetical protein